jgi:hypothetical protein
VNDPIEQFFAGYPPEVQTISRKLRAMVNSAMPDGGNEVLFARHNHVGYSLTKSMRDRICYICPMKDYVRLGFMYDTSLPDPDQMLVGEGKRLRHVKVRSLEDAGHPALQRLVEAAWVDAMTQMKKP